MNGLMIGNEEELKMKGRYEGADALGPRGPMASNPIAQPTMDSPGAGALLLGPGNAPMPSAPAAPTMDRPPQVAQAGPTAHAAGMPGATDPAAAQPQSEYPDWMTDDDKAFAEMARKAAQNYRGRVETRRKNRAMLSAYQKLMRDRDVARGRMEDLAGVLKDTPELYMEEDGKTYNPQGMAIIRQLSRHRETYKRIKQQEQDFLKQMQGAGFALPEGKDELGDEDVAALGTADDTAFDDFVERGFANALAYMQ